MTHPARSPDEESAFTDLYESLYPDLVRFVQRRAHPEHAEDVASEVFLVMWRRFADLPRETDDARAWAFGIARNILLNTRRGELRRQALGVRLADIPASDRDSPDVDAIASRVDMSTAWHRLSEVHQEALALAVFEDLNAPHAAVVLGISPVAFRLRLSRARRALRLHLDHQPPPRRSTAGVPERTPS